VRESVLFKFILIVQSLTDHLRTCFPKYGDLLKNSRTLTSSQKSSLIGEVPVRNAGVIGSNPVIFRHSIMDQLGNSSIKV